MLTMQNYSTYEPEWRNFTRMIAEVKLRVHSTGDYMIKSSIWQFDDEQQPRREH